MGGGYIGGTTSTVHVIEGADLEVDMVSTHEGGLRAAPVLLTPLGIPLCPLHLAPRPSNREAIRSAAPSIYILLVLAHALSFGYDIPSDLLRLTIEVSPGASCANVRPFPSPRHPN